MPLTDAPSTSDLDQRIECHLEQWRIHTDAAQAEFAAACALMTGRPAPADPQVERFATDVEAGDHVQWADGWWFVTAVDHRPVERSALTLNRVGYTPIVECFAGNVLLTTVRPS